MITNNYYSILKLNKKASAKEIKKAYRKLCMQHHPDRNGGSKFHEEKFKEIQEAYDILGDTNKRKKYDDKSDQSTVKSSQKTSQSRTFKKPIIDYFIVDKKEVEYNEDVTISWKCLYTDVVEIKPFGEFASEGIQTFRVKNLKKEFFDFQLFAKNMNLRLQTSKTLTIKNKTYSDIKTQVMNDYWKQYKKISKRARYSSTKKAEEMKQLLIPLFLIGIGTLVLLRVILMMIS